DLQERLRLQPLLPKRRSLAGPPAWDQQRAAGVLAETRTEERGVADFGDDEILDFAGVDDEILRRRRRVGLWEVQRDPVVRPDRLRLDPMRLAQPRCDRHRPRCMHAPAERREDAHTPVADLVAEALDDDRAIRGNRARRIRLLAQEREQVARRALLEVEVVAEPRNGTRLGQCRELARRGADLLAELERPADAFALPKRHRTGQARRRRDEHAVPRDLLDAPRRGAEQERLPRPRLVDHLLVELADATAAVDEEHAEQAAVGDRAAVRDGESPRTVACAYDAARAVPHDARAKL